MGDGSAVAGSEGSVVKMRQPALMVNTMKMSRLEQELAPTPHTGKALVFSCPLVLRTLKIVSPLNYRCSSVKKLPLEE